MNNDNDSKVIVALDFDNLKAAKSLVAKLDPTMCKLKVGKEMFTLFGPDWVKYLVSGDFKVFLDLKFHDIPNTVTKACLAAAELGVWMVNLHASGGEKMMSQAMQGLESFGQDRPLLTAVTVLTSMDQMQFDGIGYQRSIDAQVTHLAALAHQSGLDGVVCSALEAKSVKANTNQEFLTVTPGIRPLGSEQGDQSRIMTPEKATANGADYLVIGRPITQSADPLKTLCDISESLTAH
ncbi:orotidine-5'-phosphate decarboxylase [Aliikangiella sp. IMCC44653]